MQTLFGQSRSEIELPSQAMVLHRFERLLRYRSVLSSLAEQAPLAGARCTASRRHCETAEARDRFRLLRDRQRPVRRSVSLCEPRGITSSSAGSKCRPISNPATSPRRHFGTARNGQQWPRAIGGVVSAAQIALHHVWG
jgi:hypothetical protein